MSALANRLSGALLCALVAAGCGGDAGRQADGSESNGNAGAPADAARPPFEVAQAPDDPCEWLSPEEVEATLGSFSAPPVRVRPGQNPTPDAYGTGCLYTLAIQPQLGTGTVTLSVALHGGEAADLVSAASASLFGVAPGSATGDTSAAANSGWDHQTRLGTTYLARIGHIGVQVDRGTFEIPDDKARQLAAAARDKMADRPFANRGRPLSGFAAKGQRLPRRAAAPGSGSVRAPHARRGGSRARPAHGAAVSQCRRLSALGRPRRELQLFHRQWPSRADDQADAEPGADDLPDGGGGGRPLRRT